MAEPAIRGRFFDLQHVNLWDAAHLDGGSNRGQGSGVGRAGTLLPTFCSLIAEHGTLTIERK